MSPSDRVFEEYRPVLARLAYRMLGSITDTDDVLQEAYLRHGRATVELRWSRRARISLQS